MRRLRGWNSIASALFRQTCDRRRRAHRAAVHQIERLETREVLSAVVEPIADMNKDSAGVSVQHAVQLTDSVAVFSVAKLHGDIELWRTDGTTPGTYRLALFEATADDLELTKSGSMAYFSYRRSDFASSTLWRTDGSVSGTIPVREFGDEIGVKISNVVPGADQSICFLRRGSLWKSDGTTAGTVLVKDLATLTSGSLLWDSAELSIASGLAGGPTAFVRYPVLGQSGDLFASVNLSTAETKIISTDRYITLWGSYGDQFLYLSAFNSSSNQSIWVTRGSTATSSEFVSTDDQGSSIYNAELLYRDADTVIFRQLISGELHVMRNGSQVPMRVSLAGTSPLKPTEVVREGDEFYLRKKDGVFRFSGTDPVLRRVGTGGTALDVLTDSQRVFYAVQSGPKAVVGAALPSHDSPYEIDDHFSAFSTFIGTTSEDVLYIADDGNLGLELWKSDRVLQTAELVREIETGTVSSNPSLITTAAGNLLFTAIDGSITSWYSVNGLTGTVTEVSRGEFIAVSDVASTLDALYSQFPARVQLWDKSQGEAIVSWDGKHIQLLATAPDTVTTPLQVIRLNGQSVLLCRNAETKEFSAWGLSAAGRPTRRLFAVESTGVPKVSLSGGKLYFTMDDKSSPGFVLWQSNGTQSGTFQVTGFPDDGGTFDRLQQPIFAASSAVVETADFRGLRFLDTETGQVTEIGNVFGDRSESGLHKIGNDSSRLLFFADKSGLWMNWGPGHATVVKSLPGETLVASAGTIPANAYFITTSGSYTTLWHTTGTTEGTKEVVRFPAYQFNAFNSRLILHRDILYFSIYNAQTNRSEIWTSDGTAAMTFRLTDALVLDDSSSMLPYHGGIAFSATSREVGKELFHVASNYVAVPTGLTLNRSPQQASVSWADTAGAVKYDIVIRDLSNLNLPSKEYHSAATTLPVFDETGERLIEKNRVYRIWVRGHSIGGAISQWSDGLDVWLTNPTVTSPILPSRNPRPEIRWTTPVGTVSSEVWITNRDLKTRAVYQVGVNGTSYTPDRDLPTGKYAIFVRSTLVNGKTTDWSEAKEFQILRPAISVTTSGIIQKTATPEFSWQVVTGATHYEMTITRDNGSVALQIPKYYFTSYRANAGLPGGSYKIRVQAMKGTSPLTDSGPGTNFLLLVPPRNLTGSRTELTWDAFPGAVSYSVELRNSSGQLIRPLTTVSSAMLTLSQPLPFGKYSFRLFTNTRFGSSAWSASKQFEANGVLSAAVPAMASVLDNLFSEHSR